MSRNGTRFQPVQLVLVYLEQRKPQHTRPERTLQASTWSRYVENWTSINAFNTVSRDEVLRVVHDELPEPYTFVHTCYAGSSLLTSANINCRSDEGLQQGTRLHHYCSVRQL